MKPLHFIGIYLATMMAASSATVIGVKFAASSNGNPDSGFARDMFDR